MTTSRPLDEDRDRVFFRLKTLARHTLIYGFFDAVGKLGALILVPLYARALGPSEFGRLELFLITGAILIILVVLGFNSALTRYFVTASDEAERRAFTHTAFTAVLGFSGLATAVLLLLAPVAARVVHGDPGLTGAWRVLFLTIGLDALGAMLLAVFRSQEKPLRYSAINLTKLLVSLVVNVVLVAALGLGIRGVLLGNAAGSAAGAILGLVLARRALGLGVSVTCLRRLAAFGLPAVPIGVSLFVLNSADRYFLKALAPPASLGVYALAYKIGLVMSLAVNAFVVAWPPTLLHASREKTGRETLGRVLVYYAAAASLLFLAVTSFASEIVHWVGTPEFHGAGRLVGWIVFAFLLNGVFFFFMGGPVVRERTWLMGYAVAAGVAVSVGGNLLLIPRFAEQGAALSMALSYTVLVLVMAVVSQRVWPVPLAGRALGTIVLLVLGTLLVNVGLLGTGSVGTALLKLLVLGLFVPALLGLGVFTSEERQRGRALVARARRPRL